MTDDSHLLGTDDTELGRLKLARDQIAHQRRDPDRRQPVGRIAADDQLEAVKGAGERRAERAGNAGGGAAADQDAQVAAAQPERIADARGDAAGELRIAGLETDRSADPARPHRLRRDDDAAEERHAAAVQRVGFDRIDLALRPPPPDDLAGRAHHHAADERHGDGDIGIEREPRRQPLAVLKIEKQLMQQFDRHAHAGHDNAGNHADQSRQCDQTRFPRPDDGAQPSRDFELGRDSSDQDAHRPNGGNLERMARPIRTVELQG